VATATCYSSGNAGGIFGPSLFMGAMFGATVGSLAHSLAPHVTAGPGAYALVGMGAAFAGIVRTPLTSVIMIFEMTRDYSIIVPLMIANLISFFVSYRLQREPIYEALAQQEGVHLPAEGSREHLGRLHVSDILEPGSAIPAAATLAEVREWVRDSPLNAWPVVNDGRLMGVLLRVQVADGETDGTAGGLVASDYPHVHPDHPLSLALEKMGQHHVDALPVVSRADLGQLLGVVTLPAVLDAYGVRAAAGGDGGREEL
jgi:CIC family chloride channel protein